MEETNRNVIELKATAKFKKNKYEKNGLRDIVDRLEVVTNVKQNQYMEYVY